MNPKQVLFFILSVLAGLFLLMLIFPEDGIKINKDITLQFVTLNDFLHPVKQKDISEILANNDNIEEDTTETDNLIANNIDTTSINTDTAYIDSVAIVYSPIQIEVDSTLQKLEFPKGKDTLLYPFYRELLKVKNKKKKIHIVHYGDSQIEVDRMTSFIRYKMQKTFGGYGCGFHSGIQAFNFKQPMIVNYSDNWHRYFLFPHKDSLVTHRRFGINYFFTTFKALDDTNKDTIKASIDFLISPTAFSDVKHYSLVKLYYSNDSENVNLKVYADDELAIEKTLPKAKGLQIATFNFDKTPKDLKFEYRGKTSPEIYGYSFETPTGVFVDNMPVRGSGGTFFGGFDFSLARQIYNDMNTRLIIMQFGGNAVAKDTNNIKAYVYYFGKQLTYLKKMAPKAQIIVIGPADMSEKHKNEYITRKTLPFLIKKMRETALKNDCVFWNMYQAMGGENSMPSWVFHNPPLAEKDFIHFNPKGAKIIAMMFYKSLIFDYNKFIQSKKSK